MCTAPFTSSVLRMTWPPWASGLWQGLVNSVAYALMRVLCGCSPQSGVRDVGPTSAPEVHVDWDDWRRASPLQHRQLSIRYSKARMNEQTIDVRSMCSMVCVAALLSASCLHILAACSCRLEENSSASPGHADFSEQCSSSSPVSL